MTKTRNRGPARGIKIPFAIFIDDINAIARHGTRRLGQTVAV
jgi:hypothetical protein